MKSFSLDSPDGPAIGISQQNMSSTVAVAPNYYSHQNIDMHGSANWTTDSHPVQHQAEVAKSLDTRQSQQLRTPQRDHRDSFDASPGASFLYQANQYLPDMPALYQHRHSYHSQQPGPLSIEPGASYIDQHQMNPSFGLHPHHSYQHTSSSHSALNSIQHLKALHQAAEVQAASDQQNKPVSLATSGPVSASLGPTKATNKHRGSNEHVKAAAASQANDCCKFLTPLFPV